MNFVLDEAGKNCGSPGASSTEGGPSKDGAEVGRIAGAEFLRILWK
jgi:hypothetical protein